MHQNKPSRININIDIPVQGGTQKKELPLKLLVLADLKSLENTLPVKQRTRFVVDKQSLDQVMQQLQPKLNIRVANMSSVVNDIVATQHGVDTQDTTDEVSIDKTTIADGNSAVDISNVQSFLNLSLVFHSMSDFNPDNLVQQVPLLRQLLAKRYLLNDLKSQLLNDPSLLAAFKALWSQPKQLQKMRRLLKQ